MKTHQREFQFPKLLFIAESERHNPTLCAGTVCSQLLLSPSLSMLYHSFLFLFAGSWSLHSFSSVGCSGVLTL